MPLNNLFPYLLLQLKDDTTHLSEERIETYIKHRNKYYVKAVVSTTLTPSIVCDFTLECKIIEIIGNNSDAFILFNEELTVIGSSSSVLTVQKFNTLETTSVTSFFQDINSLSKVYQLIDTEQQLELSIFTSPLKKHGYMNESSCMFSRTNKHYITNVRAHFLNLSNSCKVYVITFSLKDQLISKEDALQKQSVPLEFSFDCINECYMRYHPDHPLVLYECLLSKEKMMPKQILYSEIDKLCDINKQKHAIGKGIATQIYYEKGQFKIKEGFNDLLHTTHEDIIKNKHKRQAYSRQSKEDTNLSPLSFRIMSIVNVLSFFLIFGEQIGIYSVSIAEIRKQSDYMHSFHLFSQILGSLQEINYLTKNLMCLNDGNLSVSLRAPTSELQLVKVRDSLVIEADLLKSILSNSSRYSVMTNYMQRKIQINNGDLSNKIIKQISLMQGLQQLISDVLNMVKSDITTYTYQDSLVYFAYINTINYLNTNCSTLYSVMLNEFDIANDDSFALILRILVIFIFALIVFSVFIFLSVWWVKLFVMRNIQKIGTLSNDSFHKIITMCNRFDTIWKLEYNEINDNEIFIEDSEEQIQTETKHHREYVHNSIKFASKQFIKFEAVVILYIGFLMFYYIYTSIFLQGSKHIRLQADIIGFLCFDYTMLLNIQR